MRSQIKREVARVILESVILFQMNWHTLYSVFIKLFFASELPEKIGKLLITGQKVLNVNNPKKNADNYLFLICLIWLKYCIVITGIKIFSKNT